MRALGSFFVIVLWCFGPCGCGGGAPPAASRAPEPSSVPAMDSSPSAGSSFKPGDEERPKSIDEAQRAFDQRSQTFDAAGGDCALLCKALSSMQRAAEHLCQLVAEGGPTDRKRCDDAKQRVVSARAKVTQMCGNCEDRQ